MNQRGSKLEPKLKLDMSFDEALARFVQTKPKEVEASVRRAKKQGKAPIGNRTPPQK